VVESNGSLLFQDGIAIGLHKVCRLMCTLRGSSDFEMAASRCTVRGFKFTTRRAG